MTCRRNTLLEELHEGKVAHSQSGDYADVKVVTPDREIAWKDVSRITQEEMNRLMKEMVNNIYTILVTMDDPEFTAALTDVGDKWTYLWDKAEAEPNLLKKIGLMLEDFGEER